MTEYGAAAGLGQSVSATALVTHRPFSARYDLDWHVGKVSRVGHELEGKSIVGQVLVCPGVQGGVAGGWVLLSLARSGLGFAGLAFRDINPVIVQAAVLARIPLLAGIDQAALDDIKTGDRVTLFPSDRRLELSGGR